MKQPIDWQKKYPLSCAGGINTEFNSGWDKIISDMFDQIEPVLRDIYNLEPERSQDPENQFRIAQIKEKFGSLRVYMLIFLVFGKQSIKGNVTGFKRQLILLIISA